MILNQNQIAEIKGVIASALEKVYSNHISLIERKAHERSVAFRFGLYFSEIMTKTPVEKIPVCCCLITQKVIL